MSVIMTGIVAGQLMDKNKKKNPEPLICPHCGAKIYGASIKPVKCPACGRPWPKDNPLLKIFKRNQRVHLGIVEPDKSIRTTVYKYNEKYAIKYKGALYEVHISTIKRPGIYPGQWTGVPFWTISGRRLLINNPRLRLPKVRLSLSPKEASELKRESRRMMLEPTAVTHPRMLELVSVRAKRYGVNPMKRTIVYENDDTFRVGDEVLVEGRKAPCIVVGESWESDCVQVACPKGWVPTSHHVSYLEKTGKNRIRELERMGDIWRNPLTSRVAMTQSPFTIYNPRKHRNISVTKAEQMRAERGAMRNLGVIAAVGGFALLMAYIFRRKT